MEGLVARGNSPGWALPKQWRWQRWRLCCSGVTSDRGWSMRLIYGIEGAAPLAVASIGHSVELYAMPKFEQKREHKLCFIF